MKMKLVLLLAALALAGCSTYQGGMGPGYDTGYGQETSPPPTDFGRGGNRANPPPYDTQSGAVLPETDNTDLHGFEAYPPPPP